MIYTILLLCAITATKGEVENVYTFSEADPFNSFNTHNYKALFEEYFTELFSNFATDLKYFQDNYLGRLDVIKIQLHLLTANIAENDNRLSPMQFLNNATATCLHKYRVALPTANGTEAAITSCLFEANDELEIILIKANSLKNQLERYYEYKRDDEFENCLINYNIVADQTHCIMNVTSAAHDYSQIMKNEFKKAIEAAKCEANKYLSKALDCNYYILSNAISKIAKINFQIDKCLAGKDDCQPCDKLTCPYKMNLEVDNMSPTIVNPFYTDSENSNCVMLDLVPRSQYKF